MIASLCLRDFLNLSTIYVFEVKESIADIPIYKELLFMGVLENLKTSRTGSCSEFSTSPKPGSSVEMSAND